MRKQLMLTIVVAAVAILSVPMSALAGDTTITTQVFSGGGTSASGGNYVLKGTFRLTSTRLSIGGGYALENGFWPYVRSLGPCCIGIRGNVDGDPFEQVNIADHTYLIDFLFRNGPAPSCEEEGDVDGGGGVANIADLTYLTDYLFRGGPPPPACP